VVALHTSFYGRSNPGKNPFQAGNKRDDNGFIKKSVEGKKIVSFVCVQHKRRVGDFLFREFWSCG